MMPTRINRWPAVRLVVLIWVLLPWEVFGHGRLTYAPDISGHYGGMQGVGGLESITTTQNGNTVAYGVINDGFGNVLGAATNGLVGWNASRVSLYGPVDGFAPPRLSLNVPIHLSLAYRTRPITIAQTVQLGMRTYEPGRRAFLSADPLGHGSDWALNTAFAGNPGVYFDANGRCVEGFDAGWTGGAMPANASSAFVAGYYGGGVSSGFTEGLGTGVENIGIGAWDAGKGTVQAGWAFTGGTAVNLYQGNQTIYGAIGSSAYNFATSADARANTWNGLSTYATETFTDTDKFSQRVGGNALFTLLTLGAGEVAQGVRAGEVTAGVAETAGADGSFYSVAFETKLNPTSYPGTTRYMHFKEANIALDAEMQANPALGELGISVPTSPTGSILGKSPENWVWHHDTESGVMQLVPKTQHPSIPGGIFWDTMHPGGNGGYSIWGK